MELYRQANVLPALQNSLTSLKGGFWAEGWSYGDLATQNLLLAGLAFSLGICETLVRALRLRLPVLVRGPLYISLALLFIFPLVLSDLSIQGHDEAMRFGVYLFPWFAAIGLLAFLPGANRGRDDAPNGTPWSWPWYPWSVVVLLVIGFCLRSYSLVDYADRLFISSPPRRRR
jgi:hypothetical protein